VNGAVEYLHKDQLGSVKLITAADGSLVKRSRALGQIGSPIPQMIP
jgi:hypothetical protein